jgi:polysaccharide transporter, PST family
VDEPSALRSKITRSLAWIAGASSIVAALDTLSNFVVLALWIRPEQQGLAAAALWLFPILDTFIDGGLSAAIIQHQQISRERLSTIFWLNVGLSCVAAAALVPLAVPITGHPLAAPLLEVYGLKLLFQNVFFVPQALMRRELRFAELSIIRVVANVASVAVKTSAAAAGAGPWCYIYGNFAHALVTGVGIQLRHPFRPRFVLALREVMADVRFGATMALREILFNFYTNVDYRIVIAFFGEGANGLYYFAYSTLLQPVRYISQIVVEIAYPAFARLRGDRTLVVEQFVSFTRMNLVAVLPFVAVIALGGDDFVGVLFGPRWAPAVLAMRLLCVVGVLRALSFMMPPLLDGLGHPRRSLAYATCASILLPALYVLSAWQLGPRFGWLSVALAWVVGYPFVFALLTWMALATIGLRARDYLRRVVGIPICVAVATAAALGVRVAAAGLPAGARLAATSVTLLALTGALLARFEGVTPRSFAAALRRPRAAA